MNIEDIRVYCLGKAGSNEGFPFGEGVLIFKVLNKMFASLAMDIPSAMNLKCDPERAIELREEHSYIRPGYHMNKKHWNTIDLEDGVSPVLLKELIDHSYELVCRGLKKAEQEALLATDED